MLLSEAFAAYALDVIAMKNQSAKTEENHYICMRCLIKHFGDIPIESLTFPMIRDWKLSLDKSRSVETVRNYVIKFRVVLAYCAKRGIGAIDPELIPVPQRTEKVPQFLSAEQVALIIEKTLRPKNKAIVSLLYASGIRVSELCSLNIEDLRDDRTFTIVGKGGHVRLCFCDERTAKLIAEYLLTRTDNERALFLTDAGKRITPGTIQCTFRTIRKQTGLECHPHTLRHSFATNLLRNNTNMRYVQVMLGHKSLQTTQVYSHVGDNDLRAVYSAHHTI